MEAIITVLMPVYNGNQKHLTLSINSILGQTLTDFEFLIVNDGSGAEISALLNKIACSDERVRLINCEQNGGIVNALNIGLKNTHTKWLARHDSDDIAEPQRLAKQLEYMQNNPQIDASFTGAIIIDEGGKRQSALGVSTEHETMAAELAFNSRLRHPSLFIKTEVLEKLGGYTSGYGISEDYRLWVDLVMSGFTLGGINQNLIQYRLTPDSFEKRMKMWCSTIVISQEFIERYYQINISESIFQKFWYNVFAGLPNYRLTFRELKEVITFIKALRKKHLFDAVWRQEIIWRCRQNVNVSTLPILLYFTLIK
ncbi:glycosyltransferase [Agaribacter flavus]|uniref:Glycosyltransferase n=1 Tax=Agaribacter flavus TaxID=1902781 RepID=A0ABV7FKK0_9ALTE